jgi:hypothetical protein
MPRESQSLGGPVPVIVGSDSDMKTRTPRNSADAAQPDTFSRCILPAGEQVHPQTQDLSNG